MDSVAGLCVLSVQKQIHACGMAINKTCFFKGLARRGQIGAPQNNIHVPGVPDRCLVHARNPGGHGVTSGHSIGNFGPP